jgi:hypothetical protein
MMLAWCCAMLYAMICKGGTHISSVVDITRVLRWWLYISFTLMPSGAGDDEEEEEEATRPKKGVCYKCVARVLQGCYKSVTRVLQGCHKDVTRMLQGCYKGV